MANRTDKDAATIKGTNPQHLVEKITRSKIYNSLYWKEHCFALNAESVIDKCIELKAVGGAHWLLAHSLSSTYICVRSCHVGVSVLTGAQPDAAGAAAQRQGTTAAAAQHARIALCKPTPCACRYMLLLTYCQSCLAFRSILPPHCGSQGTCLRLFP